MGFGLDWSSWEQGQVTGCGKRDNETYGSIKCGKFLEWLQNCQLLKNDFSVWSLLVSLFSSTYVYAIIILLIIAPTISRVV